MINSGGNRFETTPRTALKAQLSLPVATFPHEGASDVNSSCGFMMTSESSDADTVVSDLPLDAESGSGTISEDSLSRKSEKPNASPGFWLPTATSASVPGGGGHSLTRRLREIAASMPSYETDTSDALPPPPPQRPHRRRRRNNHCGGGGGATGSANECDILAMEEELRGLERRVAAAAAAAEAPPLEPRARWEPEAGNFCKSLSTELFGNFTDNEKVCFSYENLARHALAAASAASSGVETEQEERVPPAPFRVEPAAMPVPVESAVKRMHPMRSSAPHERYSPKPARKQSAATAAKKAVCSSPSTPTSEYPLWIRGPLATEECSSMPPMGVTSMWIPSSNPVVRRSASLSKKVFVGREGCGGEMILPSKADLGDGHGQLLHGRPNLALSLSLFPFLLL